MKSLHHRLGIIIVAGFLCVASTGAAEFKSFTSKEGKFKIEFPAQPTESKQNVPSPIGQLTANLFTAEIPQSMSVYVVAYTDYPANLVKKSDDAVLDGARDGCVKNVQGKLLSEKKLTLDKYPGREIAVELPGQARYRARIYIVNLRLYQVITVGSEAFVKSKDADKFLDSFQLTK